MSTPVVPEEWGHRRAIPVASWGINAVSFVLFWLVRLRGFEAMFLWFELWALAELGLVIYALLALWRGWVKKRELGGIARDLVLPPIVGAAITLLLVRLGYAAP